MQTLLLEEQYIILSNLTLRIDYKSSFPATVEDKFVLSKRTLNSTFSITQKYVLDKKEVENILLCT